MRTRYKITIQNPAGDDFNPPFSFSGEGEDFGEMVSNLMTEVEHGTGSEWEDYQRAELINESLDAWVRRLTGGPMYSQRRDFSDPEGNFDLTITEQTGDAIPTTKTQ